MLERIIVVVSGSYLVSGLVLAPLVIVAAALHVRIERRVVATLIGWGAVAIVFVLYLVALAD